MKNNIKYIPLSVPNLAGNELKYVSEAIKSEWVSTVGSFVNEFENKIAQYVHSKGAVSCQNGTSGLHTALLVTDVTKDDEVIVPTLTFIAAVNPVKYVGADVVFIDCDDSLNIDPVKLREFCEQECNFIEGKLINKKSNKHIKTIIVVHVFGNMADMESIMDVAEKFNLIVIEDSTEALGTFYTQGKYKGMFAGTIGNIGVYSFNGNKIITTGGGGMIVSNNEDLLIKARHLTTQAKIDEVYYTHDQIGFNYRMTNVQAAIGLAQLEQLEKFIFIKQNNYYYYKEKLKEISGLNLLDFKNNIRPNYWFYSLHLDKKFKLDRDKTLQYMASKGIQTRPIWGLISDQKPYYNSQKFKIEKAKLYLDNVLNIPCSSNLKTYEIDYLIDCLSSI